MIKEALYLLAIANFIIIVTLIHLKKQNVAMSLSVVEIVLVYFALTVQ